MHIKQTKLNSTNPRKVYRTLCWCACSCESSHHITKQRQVIGNVTVPQERNHSLHQLRYMMWSVLNAAESSFWQMTGWKKLTLGYCHSWRTYVRQTDQQDVFMKCASPLKDEEVCVPAGEGCTADTGTNPSSPSRHRWILLTDQTRLIRCGGSSFAGRSKWMQRSDVYVVEFPAWFILLLLTGVLCWPVTNVTLLCFRFYSRPFRSSVVLGIGWWWWSTSAWSRQRSQSCPNKNLLLLLWLNHMNIHTGRATGYSCLGNILSFRSFNHKT